MIKVNAKTKSQRILIVTIIVALFSAIMYLIISNDYDYIDSLDQRTEADYVTETFVIDEIWEREIVNKYAYVFFKLKNEDFNLGLGSNNLMPSKNRDEEVKRYQDLFTQGDTIKVKVFKEDLTEARRSNPWLMVKRFFMNDNREVEVYKLEKNEEVLSQQDIHFSFKLGKSGGDLTASRIQLFLFGFVAFMSIVFYLIKKVKTYQQKRAG
jgi:hypothetical protein